MGDSLRYPAKLGEEIRKLEEAGLSFSPELLINATDPTESSASSGDPYPQADSVPAAEGHSIGSLGVLGAGTEAETVIQQLEQRTAAPPDTADAKAKMLELWITAEPLLSKPELQKLRPVILTQLFGDHEDRVSLSGNSSTAQGGGY